VAASLESRIHAMIRTEGERYSMGAGSHRFSAQLASPPQVKQ